MKGLRSSLTIFAEMLVSLFQASHEARLYTDSTEVLLESAIRPGQGISAHELINGQAKNREQEPDLQEGAIRTPAVEQMFHEAPQNEVFPVSTYEKHLREAIARRHPSPTPQQTERLERQISGRVRKCEVRQRVRGA